MKMLNVLGKYYVKRVTNDYNVYNADTRINICNYIFKSLSDTKQFIENTNWCVADSSMIGTDKFIKVTPNKINNHAYMFKNNDGLILVLVKIQIFTDNLYIVENL